MRAVELIEEARDLLNDPSGDFWTDAKLLTHLNRALRDVSSRARTIREVNYRQVNAGQSVYGLPETFLGNDKVAWLYNGYWYPLSRRSLSQVEFINNSDVFRAWRPFFYDVWGRARVEKLVASVVDVSFDDFPTHSETFGFAFANGTIGVDDVRVGDIVQNVTAGADGTITEISNIGPGVRQFATGLLQGGEREASDAPIAFSGRNIGVDLMSLGTNQRLAYRLEIRDTTNVVVRHLDIDAAIVSVGGAAYPPYGGTVEPMRVSRIEGSVVFFWDGKNNDGAIVPSGTYRAVILTVTLSDVVTSPDAEVVNESDTVTYPFEVETHLEDVLPGRILVGDEIRIVSPHVSAHVLRVSPPPDEDSATGEEVLWVYLSRRHRVITQTDIDNVNDTLELDIELETAGLERLIYWCRREELGARDPETVAQATLYEDAYHKAAPDILQRNREHQSTWGAPSTAAYRQNLQLEGVSAPAGHALNHAFIG